MNFIQSPGIIGWVPLISNIHPYKSGPRIRWDLFGFRWRLACGNSMFVQYHGRCRYSFEMFPYV